MLITLQRRNLTIVRWKSLAKVRKKPVQRERAEQIALFQWLKFKPEIKPIFHIPNGGSRNKIEAYNLKRAGVKTGVPDIFLAIPSNGFHGLFIEMKIKGKKETDNQVAMIELLRRRGYRCELAYNAQQAIDIIEDYLRVGKED